MTEKCNLRCSYCMPEEGVKLSPKIMSTEQITRLSRFFVNHGVKKIRLTGGEPLVRPDFFDVLNNLSSLKGLDTLAVTTNALALNEKKIERLRVHGMHAVNISLDTLRPEKFEFISRRKGWHVVMRNIRLAVEAGFRDRVKVNVVVMKGVNDDELIDFVRLTEETDIDVRFIEYMPFDGNKWSDRKLVPFEDMLRIIRREFPSLTPIVSKGLFNQTSKPFRVEGFKGRIGFITSMTNNFCSSCNRIRLTADGHLKVCHVSVPVAHLGVNCDYVRLLQVCLFGQEEISLLDVLQTTPEKEVDEQLLKVVQEALFHKRKQHNGSANIAKSMNRPMILIGG